MATIADIPATSFYPTLTTPAARVRDAQGHFYWSFPDGSDTFIEAARVAPQGMTGTITVVVYLRAAAAVANTFRVTAQLEAITPGDALDTDAASSFDTINEATTATVPGTAGHMFSVSITMTNADSMAAGDIYRLRIGRNGDDATNDTATGAMHVLHVEVRDAA
jgi:hypothetical protein